MHEVVVDHSSHVFLESLLNVSAEAGLAFTLLMNLAANLMKGTSKACDMVRSAFTDAKLHQDCWTRVRKRLTEGGRDMARTRVKQAAKDFTMMMSALISVVFEMSQGPRGVEVVSDLLDGMDDIFTMMLDIAADTDVPDPLLLSAALETLYMFLKEPKTRYHMSGGQRVVSKVLNRLHDMAILLPYIRGPRLKDANNNKYQDLWKVCEKKYGTDRHLKDRMPALFDETGAYGDWHNICPELKDLKNPLMHRVLLDIVRLIELFSNYENQINDENQDFIRVAQMLNDNDREKILIGPSEGLVLVPDFEVKIQVLRVIMHVLRSSPEQFDDQEMGWLLRYLQSTGIGVGHQQDFLMEVLKLNTLLIENDGPTGFKFRQNFAKQAIRQGYDMLKANTMRDVEGSKDEEDSKTALSLQIVQLLRACSKPLSGQLRPFLRRVDFMVILKGVMESEDTKPRSGIREPLLRTWTGRDMREVLLPLVTMNILNVTGVGRYRAMVRMADVLQGKPDFDFLGNINGKVNQLTAVVSTDESHMWLGPQGMKQLLTLDDEFFHADKRDQQREFIFASGLEGMLAFAERMFSTLTSINKPTPTGGNGLSQKT
jgi:hypothetical protein